jgi:hypothetical protein
MRTLLACGALLVVLSGCASTWPKDFAEALNERNIAHCGKVEGEVAGPWLAGSSAKATVYFQSGQINCTPLWTPAVVILGSQPVSITPVTP